MNKPLFSPQTHIFLWDLHDVILTKSLWNWFKLCIRYKRKKDILRNVDKKTIKIVGTFLLERLKLTKKQMVSEELITAAQQTGNHALVDLTIQACSAYTPLKHTVALMKELSHLGYRHHLGSNIGQTVFDDCINKFPDIFNLFEAFLIPFTHDDGFLIKKPNTLFFTTHFQKHKLKPENVIFIDDKKDNILAAQSVGIHAIHFRNSQQLRKKLIELKILH